MSRRALGAPFSPNFRSACAAALDPHIVQFDPGEHRHPVAALAEMLVVGVHQDRVSGIFERAVMLMESAPPLVSLPIDMPCPV